MTNSDWVPWVSKGVQGLAGLDCSLVQDGGLHEGIFVKQHGQFNTSKTTWVRPRTGHHRYQVWNRLRFHSQVTLPYDFGYPKGKRYHKRRRGIYKKRLFTLQLLLSMTRFSYELCPIAQVLQICRRALSCRKSKF